MTPWSCWSGMCRTFSASVILTRRSRVARCSKGVHMSNEKRSGASSARGTAGFRTYERTLMQLSKMIASEIDDGGDGQSGAKQQAAHFARSDHPLCTNPCVDVKRGCFVAGGAFSARITPGACSSGPRYSARVGRVSGAPSPVEVVAKVVVEEVRTNR